MKARAIVSLFLTALLLKAADQAALFSDIAKIEDGLAGITGLRFTHRVPYAVIDKNQLHTFLEQRIKEAVRPADLRAEELTLKMLGLVPPEFDLRQNTVDLLTEQAAAFYDYNKKKLFVLESANTGMEERMALVHELAHALADQHFRLGRYIHEGARSDDGSTARLAVMEGQASWLMAAYLSKQSGGEAEAPEAVLDLMSRSIESSAAQYPVFASAPLYIQQTLVFPYTDGMLFQNAVYHKLGQRSFSEVFADPPVSTQQILHPERYLAHTAPKIPGAPAIPGQHDFRKLADGNLGELDYRVLLSEYAGKDTGVDAAAHLAGSSYALFEHKRENYAVLAFASSWDSEDSARKFFELYRKVMRGKWKTFEIDSEKPSRLEGHGDSGRFEVWIDGVTVYHVEGLKTSLH